MRRFLPLFVTFMVGLVSLLSLSACGTTSGGGGGLAVACGVGDVCPAGFICAANKVCIGTSSLPDASATDSAVVDAQNGSDVAQQLDVPGQVDVPQPSDVQVQPDVPQQADVPQQPDVPKQPDVPVQPDVSSGEQTVAAIEQASEGCSTLTSSVDIESGVQLEPVVVTSPPAKLKGTGGTYFTSFFAAPQSGGAADGSWAGIQVLVMSDTFTASVGDLLHVKGIVKEFYCMTEISALPGDVVNDGNLGEPVPFKALMSQLDGPAAEPWEGALLQITNVQVVDANPVASDGKTHGEATISHNGGAVQIALAPPTGSAFLTSSTGGTMTTFTTGTAFSSVTGNLQWSFGHWVLRARSDADLVLK